MYHHAHALQLTYQGGNHSIMPIVLEDKHPISTYHLHRLFLFRSSMVVAELLFLTIATRIWIGTYPYPEIMTVIFVYTLFNLIAWVKRPQTESISSLHLFLHLCIDVAALTLLLYYIGGANNPFVSLLLLPLLLVAAVLPKTYIWGMAGLTTMSYALLMLFQYHHQTMKHMAGMAMDMHNASPLNAHAVGMAISFLFSVAVILFFVVTMAEALRDRERKLTQAHEKSLKDEHVIALGTLAAGAAHELGTPLGTMAILTKEMEHEYADDVELLEQIQILREQVDRCKTTISQMSSSAGELRATGSQNVAISDYLQSLCTSWQVEHPQTKLEVQMPKQTSPSLVVDNTLQQALINLLNNAAQASPKRITLNTTWDEQLDSQLHIHIRDYGSGLSDEVQQSLGKPFFTTKADGQGLGFYLAQAVITRMGGDIHINNHEEGGAIVSITLPLDDMRASDE